MKKHGRFLRLLVWVGLLVAQIPYSSAEAITLAELRQDPELTPQKFAGYFSRFRFQRCDALQTPELFLSRRAGDCDDFATLADMVFREKGYHTQLVVVRMPEEIHVVCHVVEAGCYLDFNNRGYFQRTVKTNGSLEDIGEKVAQSFRSRWLTVGVYSQADGAVRMGCMISARGHREASGVKVVAGFKSQRPAPIPVLASAASSASPDTSSSEVSFNLAASETGH
ncbi:MAG TPA: hypothetical protein P5186_06880 [Candidatus Paceibacterota bacterium]|nr:hypothetical protein [Verrucomicrobiota bacterium]HRY47754.1 hypothetical protein [Candidatus Paceibacterota bacterium]HSA02997.1 hypothetical protein [Candidatus Paceibacterota bacterium]